MIEAADRSVADHGWTILDSSGLIAVRRHAWFAVSL